MMQWLALDMPGHQAELDLPQADDVRINDPAPVMRARTRCAMNLETGSGGCQPQKKNGV
ncbi:hypothetical protein [Mesorhizobium sp. 131-2-1]|uniref:hypothetical protein n=1 Tax=Mesorhizobium sp. 131-2-1 TaxID=2744518 RepID=UPI0019372900|nr:hypothetical protein MesoLj131a_58430 [Mesorhizobium sp. 131-2-1]